MAGNEVEVTLSDQQRQVVERLKRWRNEPAAQLERCRMVLRAAEGASNATTAREVRVDSERVRRGRGRWASPAAELENCEALDADEKDLEERIRRVLADRPPSGAPRTFEPEQIAGLIALAC